MTIDHEILLRVTGGDAASDYNSKLTKAWNETCSRAQRTGDACQKGDWGNAVKQAGATTINGMHLAGTFLSPIGDVLNGVFGAAAKKAIE